MSGITFLWPGARTAVFVPAIVQLVAISVMGIFVFGERSTRLQLAGMAVGCVAVELIAWPQGAKG